MQEMQSLSVISSSFLQAFVYKLDFSDPSSQKISASETANV